MTNVSFVVQYITFLSAVRIRRIGEDLSVAIWSEPRMILTEVHCFCLDRGASLDTGPPHLKICQAHIRGKSSIGDGPCVIVKWSPISSLFSSIQSEAVHFSNIYGQNRFYLMFLCRASQPGTYVPIESGTGNIDFLAMVEQ